ncbi:DUF2079 domain-containing protein [Anaerolineae bacterium CFX7]|nr:DUF2079 domain-containing protein [Anaerolineae bacterium CFX7]
MKSRAHYIALAGVWLMILAYGIYFSAYSIQRHRAFLTNASDLGQIDQALWNSSQGRPLEFTRRTGEQSIRLTDHVEPIFIPVSLVFLAYDNVEALLILQSFVIALGALPVFWIARQRLGAKAKNGLVELAGVLFAAMYLLFPALQAANLAEFHAVTFAPLLVLLLYHFGANQNWGRFALAAFLTLMIKEEIALLVFMLAGYFTISDFRFSLSDGRNLPKRFFNYLKTAPRVPLVFAALALFWFALTMFVIIPQFNAAGKSPYTCRYVVSEDCRQVVRGLFLQERLTYLFQLLASSGFVSLFDPVSLLLGSPLILANALSNYPAQYSGTFHYAAPVAPYFILAAIGGSAWLIQKLRARNIQRAFGFVVGAAFATAFAYHLYAGYTPIARAFAFPTITAHNELFARFAQQIPRGAKVATTPALHPHQSHREFLYRYPVIGDAEYVLLDVNESDRGIPSEFRIAYNKLVDDGTFGVVDAADGYVLLKRGAPKQNLPDAFYQMFRAQNPAPQHPLQIDFDDKIRLLGYDVLTDQYGRSSLRTYWQRLKPLDQNYMLFPFLADEHGEPLPDLNFPMTCLFWYPSAAWRKNDTVVCETLALEWDESARLGVGVTQTFDWNDVRARLKISRVEPSALRVNDGTWVDLGALRPSSNP